MALRRLFYYAALLIVLGMVPACMPVGEEGEPGAESTAIPPSPAATGTSLAEPATIPPSATAADTPEPDATVTSQSTETPSADDHELVGSSWSLVSMGPAGSETAVIEDTAVTLQFDSATQLGGSGGCNSYGTEYAVENGRLEVGEIVSTLVACAEEDVTEQEQNYYDALMTAGEYELEQGELTIWYDGGEGLLNFRAADTAGEGTPVVDGAENLAGTQWQLQSFGPPTSETPAVEGSTVTLEFGSNGEASGSGGCNSYGGDYQVQDDSLTFGEIVSTEIACSDQAVMEQEQRYFEALRTAESFTQTDERLTISYDEGQSVLSFVPLGSSGGNS